MVARSTELGYHYCAADQSRRRRGGTQHPSGHHRDQSARMTVMVLEVALIDVPPGSEDAFVAGYRKVKSALMDSDGLISVRMTHGIETPTRFVLLAEWESVEAHQAFRESERFAIWRSGIGPHFAQPPLVEHFNDVDVPLGRPTA
jgi:heme-degrading monooxygenase HmoA